MRATMSIILAMIVVAGLAGNALADLVAHYTFDDGDGRNYGSAGSAADGTLMNGASVVYDAVGQWNKDPNYVLLLNYGDGTVHQYMDCGMEWANWNGVGVGNLQPLTIVAWMQVTPGTQGNWRTIMSKGFESSWCLAMGTHVAEEDKIAFSAHRGVATWEPITGSVNVRDGQWHHIAGVVISEALAKLYIDGVFQASSSCWQGVNYNEENVWIGYDPLMTDWDLQWNGMIDEVRIYNEALSEAAIEDIYVGHPPDITLTVKVEPNDVGIDTVTPSAGEYMYYQNQQVPLTANNFADCPDVYKFDHWEGDVADANATETVVITTEDKTVTAVFTDSRECGDECHPILQGDLNGDCYINFDDFAIYCEQWLACTAPECD